MSSTSTSTGTTLQLQYQDLQNNTHNIGYPIITLQRRLSTRSTTLGNIAFAEDFRAPTMGMYNDGAGSAHRDCEVMFGSYPTVRLDPQLNILGATNPGTAGPLQSGVVFKSRIKDNFSGTWSLEFWLRFTSGNILANGNSISSCSIYNRDGTNFYGGRFWFDTSSAGGSVALKYLNSAGVWTLFDTWPQNAQFHGYAPDVGLLDKVGEWHYVKAVVDLKNKLYSSFQFNDRLTTFATATGLLQTADVGPQDLHFSTEYGSNSAVRRWINIAFPSGAQEA